MRLKSKRLISLLLAGSMMVSMVPASAVTAFAAETSNVAVTETDGETKTSGTCGATESDNVSWNYTSGVLTISGIGAMADFKLPTETNPKEGAIERPWEALIDEITEVKISEGVTSIGDNAFFGFSVLTTSNIPASINKLGDNIFRTDAALKNVTWASGFEAPTETVDTDSNYQEYKGAYVPTSMFDGCTSLGEGVELSTWLPSSFKGIGCAAFRGTAFMIDFDNWTNLEYIGAYAFSEMPNLTSFTLKNDYTIGLRGKETANSHPTSRAFFNSGLEELTIAADVDTIPRGFISGNNSDGNFRISAAGDLHMIGYGFSGNTTLQHAVVDVAGNYTSDSGSFRNARALETVVLKATNATLDDRMFVECPNLKAVDFTQCQTITYVANVFGNGANTTDIPGATPLNSSVIIYVSSDDQNPRNANVATGLSDTHGIVAVVNGGTLPETLEGGHLATPEKIGYRFEGWYDNAEFNGEKVTTPEVGKTYYAKWYEYNAEVDTSEKTDDTKTNYVGSPVDIIVNASVDENDLLSVKTADLIFDDIDAVEKVEVNGKELSKPYTGIDIQSLLNLNQAQGIATMAMVNSDPVTLSVTFNAPGEHTVKVVLKDDAGNVICTSQETAVTVKEKPIDWTPIEKGYYKLNLTDCTAEVDGHKVESGDIVQAGKTVTLKLTASVDNMKFNGFVLDPRQDSLKYTDDTTATFTMPESPVNVTVDLQPEESDDGIDAATVVTGVVLGSGAAVLTYHIGTELYAEQVLGKGVAVPKTREDVALKAWELAGKPAVAVEGEPLSETAQAEKWAVESGLMQNDAEGNFNGAKKMNKLKALRVLDKAQKMG